MDRRGQVRLGLVLVVALAACAPAPTPAASPNGSVPPAATASPRPASSPSPLALLPTPPPPIEDTWPTFDPATIFGDKLVCGFHVDAPPIAVSAWNDAPLVPAHDDSPEAQALRESINRRGGFYAALAWRRVVTTPMAVLFAAAAGGADEVLGLTFVQDPSPLRQGAWVERREGTCQLLVAVAADRSLAHVYLDPARLPSPGDRVIHLLIREAMCSSAALGRVLPPTVVITDRSITILITIARRPGERGCQEVDSSYDLTLPEALGSRQLLDGGHVPAAPITEPGCCG